MAQRKVSRHGLYDKSGSFAIAVIEQAGIRRPWAVFDTPEEAHAEVARLIQDDGYVAFTREVQAAADGTHTVLDYTLGPNEPPTSKGEARILYNSRDRTLASPAEKRALKRYGNKKNLTDYLKSIVAKRRFSRPGPAGTAFALDPSGIPMPTADGIYLSPNRSGSQYDNLYYTVVATAGCTIPRKNIDDPYTVDEIAEIQKHKVGTFDTHRDPKGIGEMFWGAGKEFDQRIGRKILGELNREYFGDLARWLGPNSLDSDFSFESAVHLIAHVDSSEHNEGRAATLRNLKQFLNLGGNMTIQILGRANIVADITQGRNPEKTILTPAKRTVLRLARPHADPFLKGDPVMSLALRIISLLTPDSDPRSINLKDAPSTPNASLKAEDGELVDHFHSKFYPIKESEAPGLAPVFEALGKIRNVGMQRSAERLAIQLLSHPLPIPDPFRGPLIAFIRFLQEEQRKPGAERSPLINHPDHYYDWLQRGNAFRVNKDTPWHKIDRAIREWNQELARISNNEYLAKNPDADKPFRDDVLKAYPPSATLTTEAGEVRIERLDTAIGCINEGKTMGHCVGSYASSAAKGLTAVYRTYPAGDPENTCHPWRGTIEVVREDGDFKIRQFRGLHNEDKTTGQKLSASRTLLGKNKPKDKAPKPVDHDDGDHHSRRMRVMPDEEITYLLVPESEVLAFIKNFQDGKSLRDHPEATPTGIDIGKRVLSGTPNKSGVSEVALERVGKRLPANLAQWKRRMEAMQTEGYVLFHSKPMLPHGSKRTIHLPFISSSGTGVLTRQALDLYLIKHSLAHPRKDPDRVGEPKEWADSQHLQSLAGLRKNQIPIPALAEALLVRRTRAKLKEDLATGQTPTPFQNPQLEEACLKEAMEIKETAALIKAGGAPSVAAIQSIVPWLAAFPELDSVATKAKACPESALEIANQQAVCLGIVPKTVTLLGAFLTKSLEGPDLLAATRYLEHREVARAPERTLTR